MRVRILLPLPTRIALVFDGSDFLLLPLFCHLAAAVCADMQKDPASRQGLFRFITALASLVQVAGQQLLQQLVAVKAADEAAGVVVVGDVRRVLGEDVADELVDRVVAFDNKGMIHGSEDLFHFCFVVDRVKPSGCVFHVKSSLIQVLASIIPKNARL